MLGLPKRFPRSSLVASAAALEQRLELQCGLVAIRLSEARDMDLDIPAAKLAQRYEDLNACRQAAHELRTKLWNIE